MSKTEAPKPWEMTRRERRALGAEVGRAARQIRHGPSGREATDQQSRTSQDRRRAALRSTDAHAPKEGGDSDPTSWAKLREAIRREARRHRRQALPWVGMGGTHIAGAAADAATGAAGLVPLGLGAGAAAGGYGYAHTHAGRWDRVYAAVAATGSFGWQATAALAGADGWMPAVLWAGGALLSLPWWKRHTDPDPDVTAEREAPHPQPSGPAPPERLESAEERIWRTRLAKKALVGSRVGEPEFFSGGVRLSVDLPPGELTTEDVRHARGKIASGYGVGQSQVVIDDARPSDNSRAVVTLVKAGNLEKLRYWTGPTLDPVSGMFQMGAFADDAPAHYRLWKPGSGAVHSLISGTTESGKSTQVAGLLCEMHVSQLCSVWLADPQMGQSLPDWLGSVDWSAVGAKPTMDMLRALYAVMMDRSARLARMPWTDAKGRQREGLGHFDPTEAMPLIKFVLEEAPALLQDPLLGPEAQYLLAKVAKMGRKTGIGIDLLTQLPSLNELGDQTVRAMLRSGNVVCLRTGDQVSHRMVGLQADPSKISGYFDNGEPTWGLGYTAGPDNRPDVLYRGLLPEDVYAVASRPDPAHLEHAAAETAARYGYVGRGQVTRDDGENTNPQPSTSAGDTTPAMSSTDTVATVDRAIQTGTGRDVPALMAATGLPMGGVRRALDQLDQHERTPS